MVSFTFCSTLAHIVRRYELGDRRALNILNWSTKADDEDFDEDDFWMILMMMYWKILRKCVFLFHICVCPTYLFLFLFLLLLFFFLLFFFLLLLFPFLGVIENAVFPVPFPGRDWKCRVFPVPLFFQFLFFSVYEVLCFSSSLSLSQFPSSSLPSSGPSFLRGSPMFFQGKCVAYFF